MLVLLLPFIMKCNSHQEERAILLRDRLLAKFSAADDLSLCTLLGKAHILWSEDLNKNEVRTCTIGSSKTSPEVDGISVELLAACW